MFIWGPSYPLLGRYHHQTDMKEILDYDQTTSTCPLERASLKIQKPRKVILLVNRDLQFRYAKIGLLIGLVSTILCSLVIFYPLYKFEILRIPRFLPLPILSAMGMAVVLNLALVMFFGIIVTHRIAGPIFALSREFADVSQGIFGRTLTTRKNDDLRYLVRCFNDMSLALQNQTYDDMERISGALEQLNKLPVDDQTQKITDHLKEFHESLAGRVYTPKEGSEQVQKSSQE